MLFLKCFYEVVLVNKDRIGALWAMVCEHLHGLVLEAEECRRLPETALVCLIKLGERLYKTEAFAPRVLDSLDVLSKLPDAIKRDDTVHTQVVAGLSSFVKSNASLLNLRGWQMFLTHMQGSDSVLQNAAANACAVETLQFVAETALTQENIQLCQDTAIGYVKLATESTLVMNSNQTAAGTPEPLASKVLNVLHLLHVTVPKVYPQGTDAATLWNAHWECLLQAMSRFCTVNLRPVRQQGALYFAMRACVCPRALPCMHVHGLLHGCRVGP